MKLIPAIDILNRVTARNSGDGYLPFRSVLSNSADPIALAQAYRSVFAFPEIYIADLDAIHRETEPNFDLFTAIKENTDCVLRIDAAIADVGRAERTLRSGADRLIIGTETLTRLEFLNEALEVFGPGRIIVSVDLRGDHLLSACPHLNGSDPVAFAKMIEQFGIQEIMVLDLPRAGTGIGINIEIVQDIMKQIHPRFATLEAVIKSVAIDVLAGSGLGSAAELSLLRQIGASAVTIARTLHEGEITADTLRQLSPVGSCYEI